MKSNYNIVKSDKFKTNFLQIRYLLKGEKENASYASLLSMYLTYSNNVTKTYKEATDYLDTLYGTKFDIIISLKGDKIVFDVILMFVSNKYLKDNNYLNEVLNTYLTYIFNPLLENNTFSKEIVNLKKYELEERIKSSYDDKLAYATERFFEIFATGYPLALNLSGYLEDIKQIDNDKLYKFYQDVLKHPVYVGGIVSSNDYEFTVKTLKSKIADVNYNESISSYMIANDKIEEVIDNQDIVQSKLLVGYTIDDAITNENYYYYFLINILFGLSSNSYLFKIVREKENLCYTIRSSYGQYTNSISVLAGIENINYEKTINLIDDVLNDMKQGKITQEDFMDAKTVAIDLIHKVKDNQLTLVNYDMNRIMQGFTHNLNEDIEAIMNIDLTKLIGKISNIKLKTKYLLSGDKDE